MTRSLTISLLALIAPALCAQVVLDEPLHFTGTQEEERQLEGLGPALSSDHLLTLEAFRSGRHLWAQVGGGADAILLSTTPVGGEPADGLMLRFIPTQANNGAVTLTVDGAPALPLLGADASPLRADDLRPAQIAEVVFADSAFFLLSRMPNTCPAGYMHANDRLCMEETHVANLTFFAAVAHCAAKGARLCTWDEYAHACTELSGDLQNMFNHWEWIDDTSDHTHTADQAGRWTCGSQRSIGAVPTPNNIGAARCCKRLR